MTIRAIAARTSTATPRNSTMGSCSGVFQPCVQVLISAGITYLKGPGSRGLMDIAQAAPPATTNDSYKELIDIGIALSVERDYGKLMERILDEAKRFTNADAGTLYLNHEDRELQ